MYEKTCHKVVKYLYDKDSINLNKLPATFNRTDKIVFDKVIERLITIGHIEKHSASEPNRLDRFGEYNRRDYDTLVKLTAKGIAERRFWGRQVWYSRARAVFMDKIFWAAIVAIIVTAITYFFPTIISNIKWLR